MTKLPVSIPENAQGRIITSVGGLYTVETSSGICTCKARGIFRKRGITPYVGDYVMLSEDGVISEILPRKNSILRPPVSNLDQIFFCDIHLSPDPEPAAAGFVSHGGDIPGYPAGCDFDKG